MENIVENIKNIDNTDNNKDMNEPILDEKNERLTVFPIEYKDIWDLYKVQEAAFWKAEEIDFSRDYDDFENKLSKDEQYVIKMILAFFAGSDGLVNLNLRKRFLNDIKIMEAQIAYSFQMMMEGIHGEVYSLMLDNIIKDPVEKETLFNAIKTIDSVKLITEWGKKWIESDNSFGYRLIAFAIVEGVFFSSAFATIFWLKKFRGGGKQFMNGLIKSNDFIARDESSHCNFACSLYSHIVNKVPQKDVFEMFDDALSISKNFARETIKCQLLGLNSSQMEKYLEYICDRLLISLGYTKKYFAENPFDFMETIGLNKKTNFFESRPTEYQSAYNNTNNEKLILVDDF
jgi:ribonucleotide reductase beta subunit family protein with ferritin-like domain